MSLGLGIFLSSIFLGIVFLFISTKDRWSWKKILFIWPLRIVLVVVVIGGIGSFIFIQYEKYVNKPKIYDTYLDIPLGAKIDDVLFLKGEPVSFRHAQNYDQKQMFYRMNDNYVYQVIINDNNSIIISCKFSFFSTESYESQRCASLNNINLNSTVKEIKDLLGDPDTTYVSDDKLSRIYVYDKYKTFYLLTKGVVRKLGIYNPPFNIEISNNIYKYKIIELADGDLIKYAPRCNTDDELKNVKAALKMAKEESPTTTEFMWDELVEIHEKERAVLLAKIEETQAKLKAEAKAEKQAKAEAQARAKKKLARAKEPDNAEAKQNDGLAEAILAKKINDNWSAIKKGLAKYQVEKILGKPIKQEGYATTYSTRLYWYYSEDRRDGPHVYFYKNSDNGVVEVLGWKAP